MKTVVSKSDVAHLWANKEQSNARNSGGNFYFERDTIYSYGSHFPIAKHVEFNGKNAVLFTERGYSNTTCKHVNATHSACSHKNIVYCWNPESSHEQNLNSWVTTIESISRNLLKAKKPEIYLSQIDEVRNKVNKYTSFFELAIPENLSIALSISNKGDYQQYAAKKVEFEQAEKLRKEKQAKKDLAASLRKWRRFETSRLYGRIEFDYLRYNQQSERVETSQGVEIPKKIALDFYGWVIKAAKTGCEDCNKKLLAYDVTSVTKDLFTIGCHTITIKEAQNCYNSMQ